MQKFWNAYDGMKKVLYPNSLYVPFFKRTRLCKNVQVVGSQPSELER